MTQRDMVISLMSNDDLIGKRVKIKCTSKDSYKIQGLVGKCGTVERISGGSVGVLVDGKRNNVSAYGLFWFDKNELNFLNIESEDINMEGYKYVAFVNLVEDYHKKDYAFALHENDYHLIQLVEAVKSPAMVVVNARGKDNRQLATVRKIVRVEEYAGTKITAEVVGVVNMNDYVRREKEKARLEEIAKNRAAIEAELEKEINKVKSVEYYEEMARKYPDNPRIKELVGELRGLTA